MRVAVAPELDVTLADVERFLKDRHINFNPLVDVRHTCIHTTSEHLASWEAAHGVMVRGLIGHVVNNDLLRLVEQSGCTPIFIKSVNMDGEITIIEESGDGES